VVWAQEEPRNMGPWRFLREQIQPLLDAAPAKCVMGTAGKRPAGGSANATSGAGGDRQRRSRRARSRRPGASGGGAAQEAGFRTTRQRHFTHKLRRLTHYRNRGFFLTAVSVFQYFSKQR
jgi:hypothetical protein